MLKGFYPVFYCLPMTFKKAASTISREILVFRYNIIAVKASKCASDTVFKHCTTSHCAKTDVSSCPGQVIVKFIFPYILIHPDLVRDSVLLFNFSRTSSSIHYHKKSTGAHPQTPGLNCSLLTNIAASNFTRRQPY